MHRSDASNELHFSRRDRAVSTAAAIVAIAALALVGPGCEPDMLGGPNETATPHDVEAPLSDLDALLEGAPDNDELPELGKADAVYPEVFALMETQTPARDQGRRGTCSIFATVGLMEHLYLVAGWPGEPNFSEQYLQWSSKVQVGSFRNSEGSNSNTNLRAISNYGIPEEQFWPYESSPWNTSHDPECEGDDRPVRCYTNGDPPDEAVDAEKYDLPFGRWVNSRSIKAHMTATDTGVVAGMKFFYQSWNHRLSELTTNDHYWREGYVTYPNSEDRADSDEKPAGHAILLVGWDDTLEVPKRDGAGELILDDEGNPEVERGFFIFKNSWGTGSFGVNNPYGDGFGYISMRYIEEFGTVYTSNVPTYTPPVEICDDGIDNTGNGLVDCEDPACFDHEVCLPPDDPDTTLLAFENDESIDIPDNDPEGIHSEIHISESGTIENLTVGVDITHTWRGDLRVTLIRDEREVVLHDRTGSSADDLNENWTVTDFDGTDMAGVWTLHVADLARQDTGTLQRWWIEIETADGEAPTPGTEYHTFTNDEVMDIPDNDPEGVRSEIVIDESGLISSLEVGVNITHTWRGDLRITLIRDDVEIVIHERDDSSDDDINEVWTVSDFDGSDMAGTWTLHVADLAPSDTGTLDTWWLEIVTAE